VRHAGGAEKRAERRVMGGQRFCAAAALPGGVITLALFLLASCGPRTPLPVLGDVPPFQLTSQTGETFERRALDGHVWVADFIFTSCPGPCPRMSSQMHEIQSATADMPDVKLVSFTVDPAHDTPAVLAAYGKHFLAQPGRWYFLTGAQNRLDAIGRAGFKLNPVDGSLDHSTRFVLVDRAARIRSYYASSDDDFPGRLLRDLRQLEREKS
jgi:protein SCO1